MITYISCCSYYPLLPPNEEVNIDMDHHDVYGKLSVTPHVLLVPSDLRYFVKVNAATVSSLYDISICWWTSWLIKQKEFKSLGSIHSSLKILLLLWFHWPRFSVKILKLLPQCFSSSDTPNKILPNGSDNCVHFNQYIPTDTSVEWCCCEKSVHCISDIDPLPMW